MADNNTQQTAEASSPLDGLSGEELAQIVRDEHADGREKAKARRRLNDLSAQSAKKYADDLKKREDLDTKEKKILDLYNKGVQNFEIAKRVFDGMVNSDTVGRVVLAIRKQHAEDFNEVEDIESTRGYTGVSGGAGNVI